MSGYERACAPEGAHKILPNQYFLASGLKVLVFPCVPLCPLWFKLLIFLSAP